MLSFYLAKFIQDHSHLRWLIPKVMVVSKSYLLQMEILHWFRFSFNIGKAPSLGWFSKCTSHKCFPSLQTSADVAGSYFIVQPPQQGQQGSYPLSLQTVQTPPHWYSTVSVLKHHHYHSSIITTTTNISISIINSHIAMDSQYQAS